MYSHADVRPKGTPTSWLRACVIDLDPGERLYRTIVLWATNACVFCSQWLYAGHIQKINDSGDLEVRMDSGRDVAFNIWEHPHLDHGYAVTSHSSQGQTADRVLIHVDTEKSEFLVNNRFAYASVSRRQYDVQIYTDNNGELARDLSRDLERPTATQAEEQSEIGQRAESKSAHKGAHENEQEQAHGIRLGVA